MNPQIIQDLKSFNWTAIIERGCGLDDLNDAQWRFIKGLVVELAVEKYSGDPTFKYVGAVHRDYDWGRHGVTVELKSQFSGCMWGRRGGLNKNYSIKLNNSMGTNKKTVLTPADVADYLIVVRRDGAFVIDRDTVMARARRGGDGFDVVVSRDEIHPLCLPLLVNNRNLNLKESIINAIKPLL